MYSFSKIISPRGQAKRKSGHQETHQESKESASRNQNNKSNNGDLKPYISKFKKKADNAIPRLKAKKAVKESEPTPEVKVKKPRVPTLAELKIVPKLSLSPRVVHRKREKPSRNIEPQKFSKEKEPVIVNLITPHLQQNQEKTKASAYGERIRKSFEAAKPFLQK